MRKKVGRKAYQSISKCMGPWRWIFFFSVFSCHLFCYEFPFPVTPAQLVGILVQEVGAPYPLAPVAIALKTRASKSAQHPNPRVLGETAVKTFVRR